MIETIITILIICLYLLIGNAIFELGLRSVGGKEGYLKYIKETNKHYKLAYVLARLLVYLFWPYFLIKTLVSK